MRFAVETEGLTKRFGKFTAVDHLDLHVSKGEIYGLLGPNGSGKTTTIKMLVGLLRPDGGSARILGKRIPSRKVMSQVGYMPQDEAIYLDNTVHENIRFFGGVYGLSPEEVSKREDELLRFVDLLDWRNSLVSSLSGGMRHRLSLACALIHRPRLLFLDEPTVGVDPILRSTFWSYFRELQENHTTMIITTHYIAEADQCSRVGLLRQGKLIAEGPPEKIKNQTGCSSLEDAFLVLSGGGR